MSELEPPQQLPRGRHRLSREQVENSQRSRMLLALAVAMSEKGYVATSVADIIKRAGVGRETFYQHFTSKLDCFMSAFDVAGEMLMARLEQASQDAEGTPLERFDHALSEYLDVLAEQPAFARVFLVEVYAAGADALERRALLQDRIVDKIVQLLGARTEEDRFAFQVLVAAVSNMVTGPIAAQDTKALRALRKKIVRLVDRGRIMSQS
jgi:AcrR family transcriptional regulator